MAERGYLTIAFDPSFTGESGGLPRYMASPDINTEDFMAAVDFLSVQDNVDTDKIGIIGICGWDGMALNTAALDTRIKATVVSTMYDMTRVNANGYFDAENSEEARYEKKKILNGRIFQKEFGLRGDVTMAKKILIISTSLRGKSNSEILAKKCEKGAWDFFRRAILQQPLLFARGSQKAADAADGSWKDLAS